MKQLKGRLAFVTGGAGGIGEGIAGALIERGMRVVIADIAIDRAQDVAALLGGDTIALELDVTSRESWADARRAVEERVGEVGLLCNNAGISSAFQSILDVDPAQFERIMTINVAGVFNGIQCFAAGMLKRGSGHIVNTSSVNGLVPHGPFASYSASKFAVLGLSDSIRQEFAPRGVGVSTLFPGLTRSRMSLAIKQDHDLGDEEFARIEANMMDPLWTGRAVADAVEANRPYIITHPDHRATLEARHAELLEAFGEPAEPGYGQSAGAVGRETQN